MIPLSNIRQDWWQKATQTYGIDYSETFSPIKKIDTIRVVFSIVENKILATPSV